MAQRRSQLHSFAPDTVKEARMTRSSFALHAWLATIENLPSVHIDQTVTAGLIKEFQVLERRLEAAEKNRDHWENICRTALAYDDD